MEISEICREFNDPIRYVSDGVTIPSEMESTPEDRETRAEILAESLAVLSTFDGLLEVSEYVQTRERSLSDTAYAFYNEARTNIASQNALPVENVSRKTVFEHLLDMLRQNDSSVAQAYSRSGHNRQADIAIILQILEHIRPVYDRAREQLQSVDHSIASDVYSEEQGTYGEHFFARSLTSTYERIITEFRHRVDFRGQVLLGFTNLELGNRESVRRTRETVQRELRRACNDYNEFIPPPITPPPVESVEMTEEESTEAEPANEQVSTYFDVFAG